MRAECESTGVGWNAKQEKHGESPRARLRIMAIRFRHAPLSQWRLLAAGRTAFAKRSGEEVAGGRAHLPEGKRKKGLSSDHRHHFPSNGPW